MSGVEAAAEALRRAGHGTFMECDDGVWMVQPFSFWLRRADGTPDMYAAARDVLEPLAAKYKRTVHSPKYDWMLACIDRVSDYMDELADHPDNPANFHDDD